MALPHLRGAGGVLHAKVVGLDAARDILAIADAIAIEHMKAVPALFARSAIGARGVRFAATGRRW